MSLWDVIAWWEIRRIPYNILLAVWGMGCWSVLIWGVESSIVLQPGEDALEPLMLFVILFVANVCYTFGWIVELLARWANPGLGFRAGPRLWKVGVIFSLAVTGLPAFLWAARGVLTIFGAVERPLPG